MRLVAENHAGCPDGIAGTGWASTVESQRFQQGSGPLSMRRAITGRIVRRDFDQRGQKVALGSEAVVDDLADRRLESRPPGGSLS